MKESIAKTKQCPQLSKTRSLENIGIMLSYIGTSSGQSEQFKSKALVALCAEAEKNNNHLCKASSCMMWEPEYAAVDKEIDEKEDIPEGWHQIKGHTPGRIAIRQYRESDCGDCGLKTKELQCNV